MRMQSSFRPVNMPRHDHPASTRSAERAMASERDRLRGCARYCRRSARRKRQAVQPGRNRGIGDVARRERQFARIRGFSHSHPPQRARGGSDNLAAIGKPGGRNVPEIARPDFLGLSFGCIRLSQSLQKYPRIGNRTAAEKERAAIGRECGRTVVRVLRGSVCQPSLLCRIHREHGQNPSLVLRVRNGQPFRVRSPRQVWLRLVPRHMRNSRLHYRAVNLSTNVRGLRVAIPATV